MKFAVAALIGAVSAYEPMDPAEYEFMQFIAKYGRSYGTKEEYDFRLGVFLENYKEIQEINATETSSTHAVNKFTDRTEAEFEKSLGYIKRASSNGNCGFHTASGTTPSPTDFRTTNPKLVTDVKDQGDCGACWTFSTVGTIEGAEAKAGRGLTQLAEQQLLDCETDQGGCDGGVMSEVLDWILDGTGNSRQLPKMSAYPYQEKKESCKAATKTKVSNMTGCNRVGTEAFKEANLDLVKDALSTVPLSIGLTATIYFKSYSSGIMTNYNRCSGGMNHAVTAVGWGTDSTDGDYMIIKNSWGVDDWGESGYARIKLSNNTCKVRNDINYAISTATTSVTE